jgi:hypothetical protein
VQDAGARYAQLAMSKLEVRTRIVGIEHLSETLTYLRMTGSPPFCCCAMVRVLGRECSDEPEGAWLMDRKDVLVVGRLASRVDCKG